MALGDLGDLGDSGGSNFFYPFKRLEILFFIACSQMKKKILNILPGVGLGELKFGMTPEEVEPILGKATDIQMGEFEIPNEEGEDFSQIWHYDEEELSIQFEKQVENSDLNEQEV